MFRRLSHKPTVEQLTMQGTNIEASGRFANTLSYNHFLQEDFYLLQEIGEKSYRKEEGALVELFKNTIQLASSKERIHIDESTIKSYFETFFFQERGDVYLEKVLTFFNQLRHASIPIAKLVTVFNQLNYYINAEMVSNSSYSQKKLSSYMQSLQKAFNIEQQILTEVFTEKILENVTDGISHLLEKNAEIVFIKDLVKNLDRQNADIQTVTSAAEEITSSIDETANSASEVSEQTKMSVDQARSGYEIISKALDEIIETGENFERIVGRFQQLQTNISSIENVVSLINGIADQTNLLALNASIEAARAGEHGKGFSVVATEVRKLAEHTMESLQEVNENVLQLNSLSENVSELIHVTSATINQATGEAKDSLPLLDGIRNTIIKINEGTNETAAIIEEQAASIDEVSQRMTNVAMLTEEIRYLGEETSKVIFELSQSINQFRLNMVDNDQIHLSTKALLNLSKSDHILWKWRVYNMFIGQETISEEEVSSHHDCRLGKWYFSPAVQERFAGIEAFQKLDDPHKIVHESAKQAVREFKQGNIQEAEVHLEKINQASEQVLDILNQLGEELEQQS